jgi:hypothetical protein
MAFTLRPRNAGPSNYSLTLGYSVFGSTIILNALFTVQTRQDLKATLASTFTEAFTCLPHANLCTFTGMARPSHLIYMSSVLVITVLHPLP